jgi:PHP family Zn ribbon phosphoesterase
MPGFALERCVMLELFYDLHLHSCLSPCGDASATPYNIANLAKLLGLDVCAITDHNSCKNCPAFFKAAKEIDLLPIAGMELCTSEEIHVLCYFPELESAMAFDKHLSKHLPPLKNNPEIFGEQVIMNETDQILGYEETALIGASFFDLYTLYHEVKKFDGIIVPAHIDRSSFSLLSSLGAVPADVGYRAVEIRYPEAIENLKIKHPYLNECTILHSSDAHSLDNMSLPKNSIMVEEPTAKAVLKSIQRM